MALKFDFELVKRQPVIWLSLGSVCLLSLAITQPFLIYDEAVPLVAADRMLRGELPYRDFWAVYPPGQFVTLVALFKLFGASVMTERVWHIVSQMALAVLAWKYVRLVASQQAALIAWAGAILWMCWRPMFGYPMYPALALAVLTLWVFHQATFSNQKWLSFVSGLLCVGVLVFKLEVGIFTTLTLLSGYGFSCARCWFLGPPNQNQPHTQQFRQVLQHMGLTCLGLSLGGLALMGLLNAFLPLSLVWNYLWVIPTGLISTYRHLSPPPLLNMMMEIWFTSGSHFYALLDFLKRGVLAYAPAVVYGLVLVWLAVTLWSNRSNQIVPLESASNQNPERSPAVLNWVWMTSVFGVMLLYQAYQRTDPEHLLPTTVIAFTVGSVVGERILRHPLTTPVVRWGVVLFVFSLVPSLVLYPAKRWGEMVYTCWTAPQADIHFDRAGAVSVDPDQAEMVALIQHRTAGDEPIFVAQTQHDQIFINDMGFYFLADRACASRYHELAPGIATTLPVQNEIVRTLREKSVRYVVIADVGNNIFEPNQSSQSSQVNVLDEYLKASYVPVKQFGRYTLLQSNLKLRPKEQG